VSLVRERTITTETPPLIGEVSAICGYRVSRGQRNRSPRPYSRLSRREPLLFLSSSSSTLLRGWVVPVPDPLLLRKRGSVGNLIRDLSIRIQELWPLDHRGGHNYDSYTVCFPKTLCNLLQCRLIFFALQVTRIHHNSPSGESLIHLC
jgi:hypothetical protein